MVKLIDSLTATTGWTTNGTAVIYGTTTFPQALSTNQTIACVFKFVATNDYVEKTYTFDMTGYDEIVFWASSRIHGSSNYRYPSDYSYKIDFGTGGEYYLPLQQMPECIRFHTTSISKVRITYLGTGTDYLTLSYMAANKDTFPLDVFNGIKTQIEFERQGLTERLLGTFSGTIGDKYMSFTSSPDFFHRYTSVKISGGGNTEYHHIQNQDGNKFTFSGLLDGYSLLHTYTNANVYLYYPVTFGLYHSELTIPSIAIWQFASEKLTIVNDTDTITDNAKVSDGSVEERRVGQYHKWPILIDCESTAEYELLGEISDLVKRTVSKRVVWINGRKCQIEFSGAAAEIQPTDSVDLVPKVQYPVTIELREEAYAPVIVPKTTTINNTVNITAGNVLLN